MPRSYPPEFRRKVLDLLEAGRSVSQIATDLQISEQSIYLWRKRALIDAGQLPGLTSIEQAELVAARRRIRELESELAIHRRAAELLKSVVPPKRRFAAIKVMAAENLPVQTACGVLGVSDAGYYAWLKRGPSPRSVRHAWLTDVITDIHGAARGVYGSRRVHAELRLGRGILVSRGAVELLMHRAGIKGLPGPRMTRAQPRTATAADLVDRRFGRGEPNKLWVTDITEHPSPVKVTLGRRVRYELDGGDRTKVKKFKATAKAHAIKVCFPPAAVVNGR
jgi:putative transposase